MPAPLGPEAIAATGAANYEATLLELDRLDAEASLLHFIRLLWSELEPERELVEGWVLGAIAEHLQAISDGKIRKLLINVPPGCMKSLMTDVFWPAWEWGPRNRPDLRYICASYSNDLTIRDNRKCRQLMQSPLYQRLWGSRFTFAADQDAKIKFENNRRGFKMATSVGGAVVGERGDRFIIDDPHNIKDVESDRIRESTIQWFTEVVPTRVNDASKAAFVVIMQRVHERDVSGLILEKLVQEGGYEHLCLPMEYEHDHPHSSRTSLGFVDPRREDGELLWPERFTVDNVVELKDQLRAWGGIYAEAGQLQQRPSPRGGGMFRDEFFRIVDSVPKEAGRAVRGWDLAASTEIGSAWTVGVRMRRCGKEFIIDDVVRFRGTPGDVERIIVETAHSDGIKIHQDLPQDPGAAGKAWKAALAAALAGFSFSFSPETGEKETRAAPLASLGEAQMLMMLRAKWNDAYLDEARKFPAGRWKDQIDASSRALACLIRRRQGMLPSGPEVLGEVAAPSLVRERPLALLGPSDPIGDEWIQTDREGRGR